jgi:farnesyl diphosphate synthase
MFKTRLMECAAQLQLHLDSVMVPFLENTGELPVLQAMRYASHGGKRLRAFLVLESARLHGISSDQAIWPAAAIEAMHAYSLVHDDLPCMDNDDMRRGQPTVHIKWDYETAVLAGDALQALAFELAAHESVSPKAGVRATLALELARAAGAQGMVLGQALDMAADKSATPFDLNQITALQAGKTGALLGWAALAGARMAEADTSPWETYAKGIGLAFQIWDDVLDVEGDAAVVGKALGKDQNAGKATFVSLLGMDAAKARAQELIDESCTALDPFGVEADILRDVARYMIARDK